jgi:transcriptional regulator with XRE-family HTH domain
MSRTTLGSKIYELRKKKGLTQTELGKLIGVSGGAISQFEKGVNKPSFDTVKNLQEVLEFNFDYLYTDAIEAPVSTSDWEMARLMWINSRVWEKEHERNSYDPEYRGRDQVEEHGELVLFRQKDFVRFLAYPEKRESSSLYRIEVLFIPGIDYKASIVLEIQGTSMAPRYTSESRHVVRPVPEEHWQYATGVHAVWLKSRKLLIKRVTSNKQGIIVLTTDATGEETTIDLSDIASLWKFGQAVHLPPEDV